MTRNLHQSITALLVALFAAKMAEGAAPDAITPFRIQVADAVLDDLKARLARTRWPDQIPSSGWERGPDTAYVKELCEHWRTQFDWRAQEARINAWPQFMTPVDGLDVHFIHARSKHENATPLVLVHGWPGSFVEFLEILGPLTDPTAYGGKAEDAFHVVVPSLPGFGFSAKPRESGWNSQRMAEVIAKLMARLGYERYGAQGGDWGGGIVRWLAANDPRCLGAHSNFPPFSRSGHETPKETRRAEARNSELADHKAYAAIQGTRPLALGYGLNDSPAGLAAWIVDKFWAWSDHGGTLETSFSKDALLTNITIYWVTETMPSSMRIYHESSHPAPRPASMTAFEARTTPPAPMGFAAFPKEINVPSRAAVERNVPNVIHWTEMPRGGHFAAMEQPTLLVDDIRAFFRKVRQL
jgi:pimeloyl-ACP methyl ester carboxylesterase